MKEAENKQSGKQVLEMIEKEGIIPAEQITLEINNSLNEIGKVQEQAHLKVSELEDNEKQSINELTKKSLDRLSQSMEHASQLFLQNKDDKKMLDPEDYFTEIQTIYNDLQESITTANQNKKNLEEYINNPNLYTVDVIEVAKQNVENVQSKITSAMDYQANVLIKVWENSNENTTMLLSSYREDMNLTELESFKTDLSKTQETLLSKLEEVERFAKEYEEHINGRGEVFSKESQEVAKERHREMQIKISNAKNNIEKIKQTIESIQIKIEQLQAEKENEGKQEKQQVIQETNNDQIITNTSEEPSDQKATVEEDNPLEAVEDSEATPSISESVDGE